MRFRFESTCGRFRTLRTRSFGARVFPRNPPRLPAGWACPFSATSKMLRGDLIDAPSHVYCRVPKVDQGRKNMSVFAWIVLGLIAGYIGSKIVNRRGEGLVLDLVLGIVGAIAGGWLFNMFGASGVTGLNLYSLLVAVVGAIAVLLVYHAIRRAA